MKIKNPVQSVQRELSRLAFFLLGKAKKDLTSKNAD
jgi:hypothetical protein